jgi:hypothetical protein
MFSVRLGYWVRLRIRSNFKRYDCERHLKARIEISSLGRMIYTESWCDLSQVSGRQYSRPAFRTASSAAIVSITTVVCRLQNCNYIRKFVWETGIEPHESRQVKCFYRGLIHFARRNDSRTTCLIYNLGKILFTNC